MSDPYRKYFWLALAVLTAVRLVFIGQFQLSPDEAYYWTWSRHLDWSYYDQGPMLAIVIRFFTWLAGRSTEFSVRLGSVALSCLSAWIFFEFIARCFRSTRAAWYGFIAFQSMLLMSVGALLMMHDSIMVCFWLLALYGFYCALFENSTLGWLGGALALGLGALAKYTMALFVPCLLLFLLLSPGHRHWWKKPHLYLAGALTLLLVSPIVFWNQSHHWASFGHVGSLGGVAKSGFFSFKTPAEFLGGQLGVITPLLGAFCLAAPVMGWKKWREAGEAAGTYLFLTCFCAPVFIFFFLLSWHTEVYANWPAPAYPAATALLAGWFTLHLLPRQPRKAKIWASASIALGALLTLLVHLEAVYGLLPLTGRAAGSMDRVRGWSELGKQAGVLLSEFRQSSPLPVFVSSQRYQIASQLAFYMPGQPEIVLLPQQEPAGNQYQFWDQRRKLAGQNSLFICEDRWELDLLKNKFDHVTILPPVSFRFHQRQVREIFFVFAYHFNPPQPAGKP